MSIFHPFEIRGGETQLHVGENLKKNSSAHGIFNIK